MDVFQALPPQKRNYMELLFRNCTEEVKYYMTLIDIEAESTFIKAGTDCTHIFIILSGKVTGVEWPMHERSYPFKDFGPGDFFLRTQENMRRLITQTAEARKYLFMEGKDRLMVHLIRKFEQRLPTPQVLELRHTRSQIAEEIGFSVKTLNRSVQKLEELGFIRVQHGKILIPEEGYRAMKAHIEHHING